MAAGTILMIDECTAGGGSKALGGTSPYFCVFEADFESEATMMAALQSTEGKAVAADVPKYATGGVTMLHYAVKALG